MGPLLFPLYAVAAAAAAAASASSSSTTSWNSHMQLFVHAYIYYTMSYILSFENRLADWMLG